MKVMCPNCNKVIEVIKEEGKETTFCNACGYTFNIDDAYELLKKTYKQLHRRAYSCVYVEMNYEEGYKLYEECLKLRDNDLTAISGMCLAKLYSQTFDDLKFRDIVTTFDEYNIVLNPENTFVFLCFIQDVLQQITFFLDEVEARLLKDKLVFYKEEYFNYFKEGVLQINELLNFFNESFSLLEEDEFKSFLEQNPNFIDRFNQYKDEFEKYLTVSFDVNGIGRVKIDGEVVETKEYDIKEIPELEELRIIVPQPQVQKKVMVYGVITIVLLILAIVLIFTGFGISNYIITYIGFIPLLIAIGIVVFNNIKNGKKKK